MKDVLIVILILLLLIIVFYILPKFPILTVPSSWIKITDFFYTYRPDIFIVILVTFMILVFIKDMHMEIKPHKKHLNSILTVETFNNADDFCSINENNLYNLESQCNTLTEKNCNKSTCCVMHKNKCVAGSVLGPKFS